jgi:hypothetical protein
MARLEPLIRVRKRQVEDKQKILADLYRQQEALEREKQQALFGLAREQALIEADPTNLQARAWFGPYANGVQQKIGSIDQAIAKLEVRIMVARDEVRAAFAEYKKIEITHTRRQTREQVERDHRETQTLDDTALEMFRRSQDKGER